MRLKFLLLIALVLTIVLTLFPDIALQTLRIEAFGWQFETRQGAFVVSLLLIFGVLWLIQRLLSAIIAGPGQLWQTLRMGGKKRREQRLRDGIAQWLDMRGDYGKRAFKKSRGVMPDWAVQLLKISTVSASDQALATGDDDNLLIVLSARIATDPEAKPKPDIATRKAHLEAWLKSQPNAPLALIRMADLAMEEQDWKHAVERLESIWKHGYRSASRAKPQMAQAWLALAKQEPKHAMEYLRKAYRMQPTDNDVVLALGGAHIDENNAKAAEKLWLGHLQQHNDIAIANASFELLNNDALAAFRKLEKQQEGTASLQWLRARLAHAGKLDGLAEEALSSLLETDSCREFWRTQAEWLTQKEQWQEAMHAYQKALDC
ncbi:MAG: heme biosynthesis HemY N-terminal domain-containing protein [Mariprofundaceae bacterium]|nr:heme biosynthesis HemY N-terminal domain-containing protein [Mariprofundaceae bacterium]